jgi:hypothetical protein
VGGERVEVVGVGRENGRARFREGDNQGIDG